MHLTLDGRTEKAELLADKEHLSQLLNRLPYDMGMTLVSGPHIVPSLKGLMGWVVIAESHIAITTNIKEGMVNADCFSCKDFNADMLERIIASTYKLTRVWRNLLERTAGKDAL